MGDMDLLDLGEALRENDSFLPDRPPEGLPPLPSLPCRRWSLPVVLDLQRQGLTALKKTHPALV